MFRVWGLGFRVLDYDILVFAIYGCHWETSRFLDLMW